ncbi:MAG TPA: lipase [Pseudonocardiaceae bacterium]|nr:lipase [Pseudonocardiaceae bacterium]
MRIRVVVGLIAGIIAAVLVIALGGTASAAPSTPPQYPVPYTFAAALPAGLNPAGSPPGVNDWSCRPSAAHPEPVVLTHGLLATRNDNWQTFGPLLANAGYCVFALTYGTLPGNPYIGGLGPIEDSAAQLSSFVDEVLAATGAAKVDIVGHSEGTVMPDYYVKYLGGAAKVDKYVSLAPIWHGTNLLGLATLDTFGAAFGFSPVVNGLLNPACASCQELLTGSALVNKLRDGGVAATGVTYTNIVTQYDELVAPYTSGIDYAPNMTNIVVQQQCVLDLADHLALAADPVAAADVLNALDPAHPVPVPCTAVLPFVG